LDQLQFDLLIECSAEPSVLAGVDGQTEYLVNTNLMGAIHCLDATRRNQADIFFLSTSRVYPHQVLNQAHFTESKYRYDFAPEQNIFGLSSQGVSEQFPLTGVRSLYGTTKLAAELFIAEYAASFGIKYVINRFGCIAGPWQMGKVDQGVVALWVYKHVFQQELSYIGCGVQGKQVRDFIHIDDALEIIDVQIADLARYHQHTFNVGGGLECSASLQELTQLCQQITGQTVPVSASLEERPGDLKAYITDLSHCYQQTGWRPKRTMTDIVADTTEWVKDHHQALAHIWN